MKVLDLFSGLGGWSQAFKDARHEVIHLDYEAKFKPELCMDIREFAKDPAKHLPEGWVPDVILASPDCRGFSVASIGKMWESSDPPVPKHDTARMGLELVHATLSVLDAFPSAYYAIENPRGMMTNVLRHLRGWEPEAITYCKYGETYQKPTRIWHNVPTFKPRPGCDAHPRNGVETDSDGVEWTLDKMGKRCHHRAARGSRTGIQGVKGASARALVPLELSRDLLADVAVLVENHLPAKPAQRQTALFEAEDPVQDIQFDEAAHILAELYHADLLPEDYRADVAKALCIQEVAVHG